MGECDFISPFRVYTILLVDVIILLGYVIVYTILIGRFQPLVYYC